MTVEGAMELTARYGLVSGRAVPSDRLAEAAVLLRQEVVHLSRLLRLAGHAFQHDNRPSHEVRLWWDENL